MTTTGTGTEWKREALRYAVIATNFALRHRWMILLAPIVAGAYTTYSVVRKPRTYTAAARFLTQTGRATTTSSLATQLGVNVGNGGTDPTQTPDFYLELLRSRPVLERTVRAKYANPPAADSQTLVEVMGGEESAVASLRGNIDPSVAPKTGIVTFTVTSSSPTLAQQIAQELLRQIDHFNRLRRQSRSMAERQFTQLQASVADSALRSAENALEAFYQRNRGFDRSPDLKFQEQRLARDVARRQQVSSSLGQAYEQAKIDEVRDTPVITVFEEPLLPHLSDPRHLVSSVLVSMAIAIVIAVILGFAVDSIRDANMNSTDEYLELKTRSAALVDEIKNPARVFVRRSRSDGPGGRTDA